MCYHTTHWFWWHVLFFDEFNAQISLVAPILNTSTNYAWSAFPTENTVGKKPAICKKSGRGVLDAEIQNRRLWHIMLQLIDYQAVGSRPSSPSGAIPFLNREIISAESKGRYQHSVFFRLKHRSLLHINCSRSLTLGTIQPKCVLITGMLSALRVENEWWSFWSEFYVVSYKSSLLKLVDLLATEICSQINIFCLVPDLNWKCPILHLQNFFCLPEDSCFIHYTRKWNSGWPLSLSNSTSPLLICTFKKTNNKVRQKTGGKVVCKPVTKDRTAAYINYSTNNLNSKPLYYYFLIFILHNSHL